MLSCFLQSWPHRHRESIHKVKNCTPLLGSVEEVFSGTCQILFTFCSSHFDTQCKWPMIFSESGAGRCQVGKVTDYVQILLLLNMPIYTNTCAYFFFFMKLNL